MLSLPQQPPTSIRLRETGYLHIPRMIKKNRAMQAHRILHKIGPSPNKSMTTSENSLRIVRTNEILEEYNLTGESLRISKQGLSKVLDTPNREITHQEIMKEVNTKNKNQALDGNTINLQKTGRPEYMTKLNRKQCNALMKVRSSMIPCKTNHARNSIQGQCTV